MIARGNAAAGLRSCELREGDFDAFFEAPFHSYGPASLYVSPMRSDLRRMLDPRENPLFRHFGERRYFTAHRAGRPVGRIVAHLHHPANTRHGLRRGYFGFFDCAPDLDAARTLLGAAEDFARARGAEELAGNFNLTAMQQLGVLTEGFENAPYTDQIYNPPHVPDLLAALGYEPFFPMRTFEIDLVSLDPGTLLGAGQREVLGDTSFRWEPLRRRNIGRLLGDLRRVLNDGFDRNPMFVPLTEEEFRFQARDLTWVLDPRISAVVHDAQGPVGAVVVIPDLNPFLRSTRSRLSWRTPLHYLRHRQNRTRATLLFWSVARRARNRGLNGAMLYRVVTALKESGYRSAGGTWIADANGPSLRQMEKLGGRPLHRLHLFRKGLS